MLLERPGELVTRAEIHNTLWPQTIVDFDHGLNKAVSKIRDALGDSSENPRFIETIPGRGYRFLADVNGVDRAADAALPAAPPVQVQPQRRWWLLSGIALLLIAAITVGWLRYSPSPKIHSLVVLPFQNLSNDASQEFFADGMTDELITHLGQISALRVISRTSAMSYKA